MYLKVIFQDARPGHFPPALSTYITRKLLSEITFSFRIPNVAFPELYFSKKA